MARLRTYVALFLLVALFASCETRRLAEPSFPESTLVFRISVSGTGAATKASWESLSNGGAGMDLGDSFDSEINPSTVRAALFSSDGNTVRLVFTGLIWSAATVDAYDNICYEYRCPLQEALPSGDYVLKVFANGPEITTGTDFSALSFTRSYSASDKGGALPMWGQTKFTYDAASDTHTAGTVFLLRAVAKVHIRFADSYDPGALRFKSVQFGAANTKGYFIPSVDADVATGALDEDNSGTYFRPDGSAVSAAPFVPDADGLGALVYIPETSYLLHSAASLLSCVLTDGTNDYAYTLDPEIASYYRNHLYDLRITNVLGKMSLTATVQPWVFRAFEYYSPGYVAMESKAVLSGCKTFTFLEKDKGGGSIVDYAALAEVNGTNPITVSFNIKVPAGGTWSAQLIWLEGDTNAFSITGGSGSNAAACSFTIAAATASPSQTNKALLRITTTDTASKSYILKGSACYKALEGKHTEEITIVQNP